MNAAAVAATYRDPAKEKAILDCATLVFAEKGFQDADVQVIAENAGVGKGTVYRYFCSKEELFLAVADAGSKRLEARMIPVVRGAANAVEAIRAGCRAYAEFFRENPELVEIFIQERATFRDSIRPTHLVYRAKNRGVPEEILQQGIEAGEIRQIEVTAVVPALASMMWGTVVCGCLEGQSDKLVEMAEPVIDIFLRGILAEGNRAES